MSDQSKFPKLKKKIANFISDEEGTILRSKAAIVGPMAVGTLLLMSKEMTLNVEAKTRFNSHASHRSHSSGSSDHSSHASHSSSSHTNTLPAHSSHSSGSTSGFSHTAGSFTAEARSADNN